MNKNNGNGGKGWQEALPYLSVGLVPFMLFFHYFMDAGHYSWLYSLATIAVLWVLAYCVAFAFWVFSSIHEFLRSRTDKKHSSYRALVRKHEDEAKEILFSISQENAPQESGLSASEEDVERQNIEREIETKLLAKKQLSSSKLGPDVVGAALAEIEGALVGLRHRLDELGGPPSRLNRSGMPLLSKDAQLDEALSRCPKNAKLHTDHAGQCRISGNFQEGLESANTALRLVPHYWPAQIEKARLLFEKRPSEAMALIQSAIKQAPDWNTPRMAMFDFLVHHKRKPAAIEVGKKLVEDFPNVAYAHAKLGELLIEAGRKTEALEVFTKLGKLGVHDTSRAKLLWEMGNQELALHELQNIVNEAESCWQKSEAYLLLSEYQPGVASHLYNLAVSAELSFDYFERSAKLFREGGEVRQRFECLFQILDRFSGIYRNEKRISYAESIAYCDEALEVAELLPDEPKHKIYPYLVACHRELGQFEQAEKIVYEAVSECGDVKPVLNEFCLVARSMYGQGKEPEAAAIAEKIVQDFATPSADNEAVYCVHENLMHMYGTGSTLEERQRACQHAEKALAANPESFEAAGWLWALLETIEEGSGQQLIEDRYTKRLERKEIFASGKKAKNSIGCLVTQ